MPTIHCATYSYRIKKYKILCFRWVYLKWHYSSFTHRFLCFYFWKCLTHQIWSSMKNFTYVKDCTIAMVISKLWVVFLKYSTLMKLTSQIMKTSTVGPKNYNLSRFVCRLNAPISSVQLVQCIYVKNNFTYCIDHKCLVYLWNSKISNTRRKLNGANVQWTVRDWMVNICLYIYYFSRKTKTGN